MHVGFFRGEVDEIRISNTARYQKNYKTQERLKVDEHTMALYHCDTGDGNTLVDSSDNGHDGTMFNVKRLK